jgi:hypothetical protein
MQHKISISPNLKTLEIKPLKNHTNPEHKIPKSKPNSTNFLQNQNPKFDNQTKGSQKPFLKRKSHHLHQSEKPHCFANSQKLQTLNNHEITELNKIEQTQKYKLDFYSSQKKRGNFKNYEITKFQ